MIPIRIIGAKRKYSPLRAQQPMKILHMDITILKTLENQKLYLYILQDNFSRAILSWTLSAQYNATTAMHNLQKGVDRYSYLVAENSTVVCDDGMENKGSVKNYIHAHSLLEQVIAQKDIIQSNSMVEALNKRLKYRFLYRHHLTDEEHARKTVTQAVEDYHQQPLKVLHGLTAIEALTGILPDKKAFSAQIGQAMAKRPQLNVQNACLDCSE